MDENAVITSKFGQPRTSGNVEIVNGMQMFSAVNLAQNIGRVIATLSAVDDSSLHFNAPLSLPMAPTARSIRPTSSIRSKLPHFTKSRSLALNSRSHLKVESGDIIVEWSRG